MIQIDGITYNVPIVKLGLSADFLDKYAQRVENGDLERELIGVYFNQSIEFATGDQIGELGRLYRKLSEPTEFHEVQIFTPLGPMILTVYNSNVKCNLKKLKSNNSWWSNLTVNFTAKSPTFRR